MAAVATCKWTSCGAGLATAAPASQMKLEQRIQADLDFFTDLVMSYDIKEEFQVIASKIKADELPTDYVRYIQAELSSVASKVWPDLSFTLKLTGSSQLGTGIKTASGNPWDQSDFDYCLNTSRGITPAEWQRFAAELHRSHCFYEDPEGLRGSKAIRLRDRMYHRRWEVVPADCHFTYNNVRLGSTPRLVLDEDWQKFFSAAPGARRATRVLKRMLPDVAGCDVTALVVRQGKKGSYSTDTSGWDLFKDVLLQFLHYPDLPQDSALQGVVRDVEARERSSAKQFGKSLESAHYLAKIIVSLELLGCSLCFSSLSCCEKH